MMQRRGQFVVPILVIGIGVGWLLNSLQIIPDVNWAWSIGLMVAGCAWLVIEGVNQGTIVFGLFLIVSGVLSILRQTGLLSIRVEAPCLVITFGILVLISIYGGAARR